MHGILPAMNPETVAFYNSYHLKNNKTNKLIDRNNKTYWWIIRLIEQAKPKLHNIRALDLGCGVGTLSFFMSQRGAIVLGIDVSTRAIQLAKYTQLQTKAASVKFLVTTLNSLHSSLSKKRHSESSFDLITCVEVIEHVDNDKQLLEDCFALLNPGGKLVITTQRNDSKLSKMKFMKSHDQRVGHLRRYNPDQLVKLIRSVGFSIQMKQDADGLLRCLLYMTNLGFILRVIRGPLIPVFQWLDKLTIKLFGAADIQIIAVKE